MNATTIEKIQHEVNKSKLKIAKVSVNKFMPFAMTLKDDGLTNDEILDLFRSYIHEKTRQFYRQNKQYGNIYNLADVSKKIFQKQRRADSKAEIVFYEYLKSKNIDFDFQVKIGRYRVDFLFDDFLIFECDGPHHNTKKQQEYDRARDRHLKKLGYVIMRLKWSLIIQDLDLVVDEIKRILKARKKR